jgi:hypothetical protein
VKDASADATVTAGWCKYQYIDGAWFKYLSEEDLSVLDLNDTWKDPANDNYDTKGLTSFKQLDDTFTRKDDFRLHTFRALMFNSIHSEGNITYSANKLNVDDVIMMKLPTGAVWTIDALNDFVVEDNEVVYFSTSREEVLQGLDKSIPQSALLKADKATFMPTPDNFQIGYVANGRFNLVSGQRSEYALDAINHIVAVATSTDGTLPDNIAKGDKVFATDTNDIYVSNGDGSFTMMDKSLFGDYALLEVKDTNSSFHFNKADGTFIKDTSSDNLITQSFTFDSNKDLEALMTDEYFPADHSAVFQATDGITFTADNMTVFDNDKTVQVSQTSYAIPKHSIGTIKKQSNGVVVVMFTTVTQIKEPINAGSYAMTKDADGNTGWTSITLVDGGEAVVINDGVKYDAESYNDTVERRKYSVTFTLNAGEEYSIRNIAKLRALNIIREIKLQIENIDTNVVEDLEYFLVQDGGSDASNLGIATPVMDASYTPTVTGTYRLIFAFKNRSATNASWFYTSTGDNMIFKVTRLNGIKGSAHTHPNQIVLDKFSEVDSELYYDSKKVGSELPTLRVTDVIEVTDNPLSTYTIPNASIERVVLVTNGGQVVIKTGFGTDTVTFDPIDVGQKFIVEYRDGTVDDNSIDTSKLVMSDTTGIPDAMPVHNVIVLPQAIYDTLEKDPYIFYIVKDA